MAESTEEKVKELEEKIRLMTEEKKKLEEKKKPSREEIIALLDSHQDRLEELGIDVLYDDMITLQMIESIAHHTLRDKELLNDFTAYIKMKMETAMWKYPSENDVDVDIFKK